MNNSIRIGTPKILIVALVIMIPLVLTSGQSRINERIAASFPQASERIFPSYEDVINYYVTCENTGNEEGKYSCFAIYDILKGVDFEVLSVSSGGI